MDAILTNWYQSEVRGVVSTLKRRQSRSRLFVLLVGLELILWLDGGSEIVED